MKKNILVLLLSLVTIYMITGCGNKMIHIEGKLEDIMTKVYEGIKEEELPMMLQNIELTEEDIEYYIGTNDIKWKEAIASESGIGSIAHSVVLIRMSEDVTENDIEDAKNKIKENANPRKWLCVDDVGRGGAPYQRGAGREEQSDLSRKRGDCGCRRLGGIQERILQIRAYGGALCA